MRTILHRLVRVKCISVHAGAYISISTIANMFQLVAVFGVESLALALVQTCAHFWSLIFIFSVLVCDVCRAFGIFYYSIERTINFDAYAQIKV